MFNSKSMVQSVHKQMWEDMDYMDCMELALALERAPWIKIWVWLSIIIILIINIPQQALEQVLDMGLVLGLVNLCLS